MWKNTHEAVCVYRIFEKNNKDSFKLPLQSKESLWWAELHALRSVLAKKTLPFAVLDCVVWDQHEKVLLCGVDDIVFPKYTKW